jgi:hypothetical protein
VQQHIALAAASVVAVFEHLSVCSNVSADRVFQSSIRTLRCFPRSRQLHPLPLFELSLTYFQHPGGRGE